MEQELHFVWVYVKFGQVENEIQYSIRSVEKYYQGDRKIFIVGDKPNPAKPYWQHISHTQVMNLNHAKVMDSISKLRKICECDDINENFVYLYDDQFLLRKFFASEVMRSVANNHVDSLLDYWNKPGNLPSKTWREQFRYTIDLLKQHGKGTWNYETHLPRYLNKTMVMEVIETYGLTNASLAVRPVLFATLYGNHVRLNPDVSLDVENRIRCGLYHTRTVELIRQEASDKLVMNFNDNGYDSRTETFIKERLKQ